MNQMIEKALSNRVAANLFALIIIAAGLAALGTLTVRLFPNVVLYSISVTVPYPGATPSEVETSIIKPIEERLEGLEGITRITSLAGSGVASVVVDIDESEDITDMLDDIQTEIDRITVFPQRSERPQIIHAETEELASRIVVYGDVDLVTLKQTAERIRQDLTDKANISRANIGGVPDYLIDIAIPSARLEALGLSLVNISDRIQNESLDLSGGDIEGDAQKFLVRATGERRTGDAFEDVVIGSSRTGAPVYLSDIASIDDGLSEAPVRAYFRGQPAAFVSVLRTGDEKLLDLASTVIQYLDEDVDAVLPVGVSVEHWRNESTNLADRIDLLSRNAVIGLILVAGLLMAFLDIRIAAWVAFGVSLSFVGAFSLMGVFDVTINQLSLFGFILAIGIVVDDAIVVGENIHGTWRNQKVPPKEAARLGVLRVSTPVLFSVSTTIVAFLPLLVLPGTFGQFMAPIASVVIFVLLISLFDSFFILPHHLSHLREGKPRPFSPRQIADPFRNFFAARLKRFIQGPLRRVITFIVHNPRSVVMMAFGVFFLSLSVLTSGKVKWTFFPAVEGDYVNAELTMSETTAQDRTSFYAMQIAQAAEEAIKPFDGAQSDPQSDSGLVGVFWTLGKALSIEDGDANPSGGAASNRAFITARLSAAAGRDFSADDFIKEWRKRVGDIPGAQKLTYTADLVAPGAPIQLSVSTRNQANTSAATLAVANGLREVNGVYDVRDDRFRTTDEIQIRIKPLARSFGLNQEALARQIRATFFGAEATRVQRDREEIQVRIRLPKDERRSLEDLKQLRLRVGDAFVPIYQLADVTIAPAPATINRIDGRQIFDVSAYVDESILTADEAMAYLNEVVLPRERENYDGLMITVSGNQEEQSKTIPAIMRTFAMAMLVIFTLLALNFRSYSQPLIVMCAIPFGFMGSILGHAAMGMNMSLLSMFGIIGLSGVIINNSLMVISFLNERLAAGEDHESAVIEASLERFRAILLTTLTTFLGVTPIILETSLQAQFLVPTAVSLGFGIIIGTTTLVFTLPALAILHLKVTSAVNGFFAQFSPKKQATVPVLQMAANGGPDSGGPDSPTPAAPESPISTPPKAAE